MAEGPPVLVEGGHYTLAAKPGLEGGELIRPPGGGRWWALTSPTTRRCFADAVAEALRLRGQGVRADVGLLVGDLVLPPGSRPLGGAWALPESYRGVLAQAGLRPEDLRIWGEAYARNQGKRRLLDEVRARKLAPEQTYREQGWLLFRQGDEIRLASDASLEWEGDVRAALLLRGANPLCPLIFAGLKRAIFQDGYGAHIALYALADDPWIDRKLRAAAAAVGQLRGGRVGLQVDRILVTLESPAPREQIWRPQELVGPGELPWEGFLAELRLRHPELTFL